MDGPIAVNCEPAEEPLRGKPKTVTVERRDLRNGVLDAMPSVREFVEFAADGTLSGRTVHRGDGSISLRALCFYDEQLRLVRVESFDGGGALVRREVRSFPELGVEVADIFNGVGVRVDQNVTGRGAGGEVLESATTSFHDAGPPTETKLWVEYDEGGRQARAVLEMEQSDGSRISVVVPDVGELRDGVEQRDEVGNWTRKTLASGEVSRVITYYSE